MVESEVQSSLLSSADQVSCWLCAQCSPRPRPAPPRPAVVSAPAAEANRLCSLQRGNIRIVTRFYLHSKVLLSSLFITWRY